MPRDEYDDRDDDRPRRRRDEYDDEDDRPRRRRRDPDDRDYDRQPPKSNTGLILLIVGLVVGLPMLACAGFFVWGMFAFKNVANQFQTMIGGSMAAESFLNQLEGGNTQLAYDMTSANFRATTSKAQFEQLVKANPVLTSANSRSESGGLPTPTGTAPTRQLVLTYTVTPGHDPDGFVDEDDPDFKPKVPKPKAKENPAAKGIVCTVTVAEQPDGTWKVDKFTVP
jgi:hypothetical protein